MNVSLALPDPAAFFVQFDALLAAAHRHFSGSLGGRLLLLPRLSDPALPIAANIAGAALLGIDRGGEALKWGIRNGVCDVLVNHLDEALRILKNEVRKHQPVSVWLQAEVEPALLAMLERGVQPDLLAGPDLPQYAAFRARGAVTLAFPPDLTLPSDLTLPAALAHNPLDDDLATRLPCEVICSVPPGSSAALARTDALVADLLPASDDRRRWLQYAPRYLGRTLLNQRYLRMTTAEFDRLLATLGEAAATGQISVPITVTLRTPDALKTVQLWHAE